MKTQKRAVMIVMLKLKHLFMLASLVCVQQLAAQNIVFTYQGRVTDNGTNFNGTGQFKFALVTSTNTSGQATAVANLGGTGPFYVNGYTVTSGGSGYVTAPAVTISGGGGSGATAVAVINGSGVVIAINPQNVGSGYTSAPTVSIAPPPANISYTTYWSNDGTSVDGGEPAAAVGVAVNDGLFTAELGDTNLPNMAGIDSSLFAAQQNLQLRIWFNDGANGFAALDPAQNLTPAPFAIRAQSANGLPGLSVQQTADGAPNVIGGSPINFVSGGVEGATIGGGGTTNYFGEGSWSNSVTGEFGTVSGGVGNTASGNSTVGGGVENTASGSSAVVSGGVGNTAGSFQSTVGGGYGNFATGQYSVISGGQGNKASGYDSTIGGGEKNVASGFLSTVAGGGDYYIGEPGNTASGDYSTVGGGHGNQATNSYATVPGGYLNLAGGQYSFAAGQQAQAIHQGTFVWADSQNAAFSSATNDSFNVRAQGGVRFVTGGAGIILDGQPLLTLSRDNGFTIEQNSSGAPNIIEGATNNFIEEGVVGATIGGGGAVDYFGDSYFNSVTGLFGTVSGGAQNVAGFVGTVGGGFTNSATGDYATVPGGVNNVASGEYSFAAGQQSRALHRGAFVWADSQTPYFSSTGNDQFLVRAGGGVGINNNQPGNSLDVQGYGTTNGGVSGYNEVVARFKNTRGGSHSAVAIDALANQSSILYFTEDGVPKWDLRHDRNQDNLSAFWHHDGAFSTPLTLTTNGNLTVTGSVTANGVLLTSDKNAKENFSPLNAQTILEKVASLPVTRWNYKTDDAKQKHIGPMAQDFHAAFGLDGKDDKHISVIDEGGVALAAIQGLNQKLTAELKQRAAENAELRKRLDRLEKKILDLTESK
jgi:hypothetical protein